MGGKRENISTSLLKLQIGMEMDSPDYDKHLTAGGMTATMNFNLHYYSVIYFKK